MNTLVIVLIAAVCLIAGYTFYGSWLAKKWGIDPKAKTPAVAKNDGQDYVPTDGWTVFAHQFSSIAGAGPVTGAIQAAVFGWVPVLLWILIGGIFFGAVTDFGALYASVKNEGKSMGLLIEKYIGKTGKKLFLLFCWLFTLIVIAAFADMVAGTFNAYETVDGVTKLSAQATVNGAAGSISLLFIAFAVVFGLLQKKLQKVLAKAKADIEAAEGKTFDLIFCGKESTDYAASQTGLLLAAELNVPAVTNVVAVETADGTAKIRQETETGYNEVEASMPCVVTIQKPNYDPRYPTIKSKMAARKKPIGELETGEIPESSMEVVKVYAPAKRQAGVKIKAESPEESVAQAMKLIADAKVL